MPSLEDRQRAFDAGPSQSEPFDVWPGDVDRMPPLPFPYLGDFVPHGWRLVKTYDLAAFPMSIFLSQIETGKGYAFVGKAFIGEYEVVRYASPELD